MVVLIALSVDSEKVTAIMIVSAWETSSASLDKMESGFQESSSAQSSPLTCQSASTRIVQFTLDHTRNRHAAAQANATRVKLDASLIINARAVSNASLKAQSNSLKTSKTAL